ncbi:fasciclin-like arabinogalactan protein 16 [Pyrus ussuriensis x Pyrus communis]|uniref:Fasciclin-like arabinogalactan protein 16 n=1 Tax=Pyrus ussuriensis x Pyrus communis TaxID=2448454 RepID=A0A5N5H037_9ROSA|nr:fasciclin-like arabinogalactan protein 16 [Pyrus ussuriensis x Pyrus communis]
MPENANVLLTMVEPSKVIHVRNRGGLSLDLYDSTGLRCFGSQPPGEGLHPLSSTMTDTMRWRTFW